MEFLANSNTPPEAWVPFVARKIKLARTGIPIFPESERKKLFFRDKRAYRSVDLVMVYIGKALWPKQLVRKELQLSVSSRTPQNSKES